MKRHLYQQETKRWAIDRFFVEQEKGSALFADPGLGKTLITLDIFESLRNVGQVSNALVVAPIDVIYKTWPEEIHKFGFPYRLQLVHGTRRQRMRALNTPADIHLINPDGVRWLTDICHGGWDFLIVDESTCFKNWSAKRTQALIETLGWFKNVLILTGTPQPNSVKDLFSQIYLLDEGEALGHSQHAFHKTFCKKGGFKGRVWSPEKESEAEIHELIAPMCYRLDEKDHLDLPERIDSVQWVDLPPKAMKQYKDMESELFLLLEEMKASQANLDVLFSDDEELSGKELTATNAGAKYQLCRGIANGGIYESEEYEKPNGRRARRRIATHLLHQAKVDRLERLHDDIYQKPMLVAYQFNYDREQILKRFPNAKVIAGGQRTKAGMRERLKILKAWDKGQISMLLVQPQSLSHGANLQAGGHHICWFGLSQSLETYQQFNKRLHRQGQKNRVHVYHILASDTVETVGWERLQAKDMSQRAFLQALKEYRKCRLAA